MLGVICYYSVLSEVNPFSALVLFWTVQLKLLNMLPPLYTYL